MKTLGPNSFLFGFAEGYFILDNLKSMVGLIHFPEIACFLNASELQGHGTVLPFFKVDITKVDWIISYLLYIYTSYRLYPHTISNQLQSMLNGVSIIHTLNKLLLFPSEYRLFHRKFLN
jgi:hypothetical protein